MGDRGRRVVRRVGGSRLGRSRVGRSRVGGWARRRAALLRGSADAGMATVEYAIVTVAAAAFAGLLLLILRSDEVRELLFGIVRGALST
jgi:limonene-1,2-epoxide hydrolase